MKTPAQDAENPDQEPLVAPIATADAQPEASKDLTMNGVLALPRLDSFSTTPADGTHFSTFVAGAPLLDAGWALIPTGISDEELERELAVATVTDVFRLVPGGPCTLPSAP